MAVLHGPRKLVDYEPDGSLVDDAGGAGDEQRARAGMAR